MATDPLLIHALVLVVGFAAGIVSGIVGTGATIILLPILVLTFGPREAVPIMAVVALMSNFAKITSWWREIDWRACAAYALGGIPAAALGARTLLVLPERIVDAALGLFFLAMVPGRRWLAARNFKFTFWHLAIAGAVIGFLTGIVVSTGPLSVPAFAAYGLVKGAFIATEAAGSLAIYVSKVVTFRGFGALPWDSIAKGLIVGSSLMVGSYAAKFVVGRMSVDLFRHVLDIVLLISGVAMIWAGLR